MARSERDERAGPERALGRLEALDARSPDRYRDLVQIVTSGVTRVVFLAGRWAVKVPRCHGFGRSTFWELTRGWLANRSEWRQRDRPGVARPIFTVCHFVVVYPRCLPLPLEMQLDLEAIHDAESASVYRDGHEAFDLEETKPSSWKMLDGAPVLVDFDRAWEDHDRGWVGQLYYWRQDWLGRRWARVARNTR